MVKFMIVFRHPADASVFENSYQDLLALIERMPDIQRRQVIHVTGSPLGQSPYLRILEVYFADKDTMQASLQSPAGQEAGGQMGHFPVGSFEMLFADVYEETGGYTPAQPTNTGENG